MPHSDDAYCQYCGVASLWRSKSYKKNDRRFILKCNLCQKGMCVCCCHGFKKAMDETKYIDREFWVSDPIYKTLSRAVSLLHVIGGDDFRLPCCEKWEEVRMYNSVDYIYDESSTLKDQAHDVHLKECVTKKCWI